MTEKEWYKLNNCTHAHCPDGCEHPQPIFRDGKMYCGRCYFKYNEIVVLVPCNPEVCHD